MGNTNPTLANKGSSDAINTGMKGRPILYHQVHSENVQLSLDLRRAKRVESFCKGICFSDRPIAPNERVHLKFAEVSTSWSGVVRLGFTSHDPTSINASELPRYACPDLTYKPGYWAKALPERYSEQGTTLFYYLTKSGDVMFGINGEEKGVFFSSVATNVNLWALVDIYGNTTCMEFIDGWQLNNVEDTTTQTSGRTVAQTNLDQTLMSPSHDPPAATPISPNVISAASSTGPLTSQTITGLGLTSLPPVKYHLDATFTTLHFHHTMGRNVCLSSDRTVAVRLVEEYCNGYVFTHRPLQCGEALIIQVLSLEQEYTGGLAFGMTSCDPTTLSPEELPDDSDLLLDRPEYWIVNKDVCSSPEVGDELSFYLTTDGEVRYGKNGHHITSLMYIDKTLPMWVFFDVYGNVQKVKCLGVIQPDSLCRIQSSTPGLKVALPPPKNMSQSKLQDPSPDHTVDVTPPPRPPPPKITSPQRVTPTSHSRFDGTPTTSGLAMLAAVCADASRKNTPPTLPPKNKPNSHTPPLHPAILMQSQRMAGSPLPPPLLPTPFTDPPSIPQRHELSSSFSHNSSGKLSINRSSAHHAKPLPQIPPSPLSHAAEQIQSDQCDEALDNETNECKVCMNNAVDCVLYTCGHMCLCYECAQDIKYKHNLCPICRQDIKDIIRIYRS